MRSLETMLSFEEGEGVGVDLEAKGCDGVRVMGASESVVRGAAFRPFYFDSNFDRCRKWYFSTSVITLNDLENTFYIFLKPM